MLEIKNVKVLKKDGKHCIINNLSFYEKNGRLIPKNEVSDHDKKFLLDYASNEDEYEIIISNVLYNGKNVNRINDPAVKNKILKLVNKIKDGRNKYISNYVLAKSFDTKRINSSFFSYEMNRNIIEESALIINSKETKLNSKKLKFIGRPLTNSGFTLIELIATISILAVLSLIAVPNIVGVTEKNKNKTYVEDAKRMISLAEYKVNVNSDYKPTNNSDYICVSLNDLGKNNFAYEEGKAPNGGTYDLESSYVRIGRESSGNAYKISYEVQLIENKDNTYFGIEKTTKDGLYRKSLSELAQKNLQNVDTCDGRKVTSSSSSTNLGGDSSGADSVPKYDSDDLILYINGKAYENYNFDKVAAECKEKGKTTITFKLTAEGVTDYSTSFGGNIDVLIGSIADTIGTAKYSTATDSKAYQVDYPIDCRKDWKFTENTGQIQIRIPSGILWKDRSNWTGGNKEQIKTLGTKTMSFSTNY